MYGLCFGSLSIASCMHSIVVVSPVTSKNDITFAPSIRIDSTIQNSDVRYANAIPPWKTVSALLANTSYPKDALVYRRLRILYVAMRIRRRSFSSRHFSLSIVFLSPSSFVEAD
jgi:hypothetical protein